MYKFASPPPISYSSLLPTGHYETCKYSAPDLLCTTSSINNGILYSTNILLNDHCQYENNSTVTRLQPFTLD